MHVHRIQRFADYSLLGRLHCNQLQSSHTAGYNPDYMTDSVYPAEKYSLWSCIFK